MIISVPIPAGNQQPGSQVHQIKTAYRGMELSKAKAALCSFGACLATALRKPEHAERLAKQALGNIGQYSQHSENLREATRMTDTNHQFGGASSPRALERVIERGQRRSY